jgi:hypothetical protein
MLELKGLSKFPANGPTGFSLYIFAINFGHQFLGGEEEYLDLVRLENGILMIMFDSSRVRVKSVSNFFGGLKSSFA